MKFDPRLRMALAQAGATDNVVALLKFESEGAHFASFAPSDEPGNERAVAFAQLLLRTLARLGPSRTRVDCVEVSSNLGMVLVKGPPHLVKQLLDPETLEGAYFSAVEPGPQPQGP